MLALTIEIASSTSRSNGALFTGIQSREVGDCGDVGQWCPQASGGEVAALEKEEIDTATARTTFRIEKINIVEILRINN